MSRDLFIFFVFGLGCLMLAACGQGAGGRTRAMASAAEDYVRLVLAVGRHDDSYVDAYYGPEAWRRESDRGDPVPIPALLERAREILSRVREAEPSRRGRFLEKQIVAVEAYLRLLSGERMTLSEEARLLSDIEAPARPVGEFVAARERLEALLPGETDLGERVERFRQQFAVDPDRLEVVVRRSLGFSRERTAALIPLPEGEAFRFAFVRERPWGAYNWYEGNLLSRIEVNTDLPARLASIFATLVHEGYPGHHTYNALLEDRLVRARGWQEYSVYPLHSPQSVVAEGTANVGLSVIMTEDERWAFIEGTLAPLAGLQDRDFATYRALGGALRPLRYVRGEAARMLLDEGRDEDEVAPFLRRYGLESEDRARKSIEFARAYRSYVFNYTAGEDLVRAWVGDGDDRVERFFGLLQEPVTPSDLSAH